MTSTKDAEDANARVIALDTVGSLSAPPGSREWVRAVQVELQALLDEATSDLRAIRVYLKGLVDTKGYQQLDDECGHPFPSLRAFAQAPRPWGLAYDPDLLDAIQAETRPITLGALKAKRAHDAHEANQSNERVPPAHRPLKSNYINENNVITSYDDNQGNSRTYAMRRLAKDRPDLHAQCLAGELTANAAMVQAGFRKRPPSRKRTPLDALRRAWQKASPEDRAQFLAEVSTPCPPPKGGE
jgi:hypothetical protein